MNMFPHLCTIKRRTVTTSDSGMPVETFSIILSNVVCRVQEQQIPTQKILDETSLESIRETFYLTIPGNVAVADRDQITNIRKGFGNVDSSIYYIFAIISIENSAGAQVAQKLVLRKNS